MKRPHLVGLLSALLALLAVSFSRADERPKDEFDRLSRRLERQARELRQDVLVAFRAAPQYGDLDRRLQEVERLAVRIHEMAERDERSRRVREVLERLEDEFRNVDRFVDDLGRNPNLDRRAYDRVRDDLREMRELIHRMRREL
jgi:hypothetical protein